MEKHEEPALFAREALRLEPDDPPFTVGVLMINPDGGNASPVVFAPNDTVPEPASLAIFLGGFATLAGFFRQGARPKAFAPAKEAL